MNDIHGSTKVALLSLAIAAFAVSLPSAVRAASACRVHECDYFTEFQDIVPGHCGPIDNNNCGCYADDPEQGTQPNVQAACKIDSIR